MTRLSIFDKNGYFVGDIRAATVRSWTLASTGVVGECSWDMSMYDDKTTLKYLDFGKYVLARHPSLPDWIGYIYPPQDWGFNQLTMRAYQMEGILSQRDTPDETLADTAGGIFRDILVTTNGYESNEKPIRPGAIFEGGSVHELQTGDDAYSCLVDLIQRTGYDFDVNHSFDVNNRLFLIGSLYEMKGVETNFWLREGYNLELSENPLSLYGDLYNEITGFSDADTEQSRLSFRARSDYHIARWGLFRKSMVYDNVVNLTTVQAATINSLISSMNGQYAIRGNGLNVGSTFSNLRPGNILNIDMNRAGFAVNRPGFGYSGRVRIMSMEYDDLIENRVNLNLETFDE